MNEVCYQYYMETRPLHVRNYWNKWRIAQDGRLVS